MSIKSFVSFVFTCTAAAAFVAGTALAADPAVKCESGKLKESGKYGFCRLKAESVAVKKGLSLDYSKCDTKFSGKWDKLELKGAGECPSENDFADLQNRITEHTDLVSLLLSGVGLGNEDPDAVYVATPTDGGADTATCGSQAEPCATIAFGLQPSTLLAKLRVYVAGGEFFEDITLSDGIDVLGGFDPDSWESAPGTNPTILYGSTGSSHRAAVTALNITSPTSFDGFVVYAAPATTLSSNSYGVYVSASSAQLVITNNVIFANSGAAGGDGVGGAQGQIGMDGDGASPPGADAAYDAFIAASAGFCNAANNRQFANGGFRSCGGDNVSGGAGGGNQCAPVAGSEFSGIDGAPGSGTGGGPGGDAGDDGELLFSGAACSVPPAPTAGREGSEGAGGSDGLGGTGCGIATGLVAGGHWISAGGTSGSAGLHGSGGGGGGGGGGGICTSCAESKDRLGGHGGGGGSGGCGGGAGNSGTGGGGSFGLFVVGGSAPIVLDNTFYLGTGGHGGNGGNGGNGGQGGDGGEGGDVPTGEICHDAAGTGGSGGSGGHGGGSGGGCGGGVFGIYTSGVGSPTYCDPGGNNLIAGGLAGVGGNGGLSLSNNGAPGVDGSVIDCSFN